MIKKEKALKNNVVKFPSKLTDLEKQIEAVIFAAAEPLDVDTIESKISKKSNVAKSLKKLQQEYSSRGINLVCIKNKWSFRTSPKLSSLMTQEKTVEKKIVPPQIIKEYGYVLNDYKVIKDTIKSGESFGVILDRHHVMYPTINKIASTVKETFDVRRVRAGKPYTILAKKDLKSVSESVIDAAQALLQDTVTP